jgi:hypothetical protein
MKKEDILKILEEADSALGNLSDRRIESYKSEEFKNGASKGGKIGGGLTRDNNIGIHTSDEELRRVWATMGGEASIDQLLQWQKENGHNIGEISKVKTEEWIRRIGEGNKGKVRSEEYKNKVRDSINKLNESLSKEEKSKIYSNDARKNAARIKRIEILDSIESDEFTTTNLIIACKQFDYDHKLLGKDTTLLKMIHKGTNQNNPSIYKKIY